MQSWYDSVRARACIPRCSLARRGRPRRRESTPTKYIPLIVVDDPVSALLDLEVLSGDLLRGSGNSRVHWHVFRRFTTVTRLFHTCKSK